MIVFDLKCDHDHVFEAWFKSSSAFEEQREAGDIQCPMCGSQKIEKSVMAPNVAAKGNQRSDAPSLPKKLEMEDLPSPEIIEQAQQFLSAFQKTVEDKCDYVGDNFAEEARKIHYGEAEERGIYGEATADETAELIDEGVEVLPMPSARRTDA